MSRDFNIGNIGFTITGDILEYNTLKSDFDDKHCQIMRDFCKNFSEYSSLDDIVRNCSTMGYNLICDLYGYYGEEFINHGNYDFNKRSILSHKNFDYVKAPFVDALVPVLNAKKDAIEYKESENERRAYRKETRGRVVGGGFGLGGALKGMAQAGAINIGTGLAHSAWNMVGNTMTSMKVSGIEKEVFENCQQDLVNGFAESAYRVLDIIASELGINVQFNIQKAKTIASNLKNGIIKGDNIIKAFVDGVKENPYNEELYKAVLQALPKYEDDILAISKFFNIDLGSEYNLNGFSFTKKINTELAKMEEKQLEKIIEAKSDKGLFEALCFENLRMGCHLVLTNLLLSERNSYYKEHPVDNQELQEYRNYQIKTLREIREECLNTYNAIGYIVGDSEKSLNPDSISVKLALANILSDRDYFYYGHFVPSFKYTEFCSKANVHNVNARIYAFIYDDDSSDRCLINEDGFYYLGTFDKIFIPLKEITRIQYQDGITCGRLRVNSTNLEYITVKQELQHAAIVLNSILEDIQKNSKTNILATADNSNDNNGSQKTVFENIVSESTGDRTISRKDNSEHIAYNAEEKKNTPLTEKLWFGWIIFFIFYPLAMYFFYKGGHKKSFYFCAGALALAILGAIFGK